jgi:vancomycin aglycone glucosyltransferase
MRVLLSACRSRGDVEPMMGLAVQLGALGAEVRVCAPVTKATPPSVADLSPRATELVAALFDTVAAAAEERDAPVATGVMPTGGWR